MTLFCFIPPLSAATDSSGIAEGETATAAETDPALVFNLVRENDAGRMVVLFHTSGLCALCLTQTQTVSQPPLVKLGFTFESFNCSAVIDAH